MSHTVLIPIEGIPSDLIYDRHGVEGAMAQPFAAASVVERLSWADRQLKDRGGVDYGLLIWDAYRTPATQQAIFERYVQDLMADGRLDSEDARATAGTFVTRPDTTFPHGTGGAVDLTLTLAGQPAQMGTGFDDFSAEAAANWFRLNTPRSAAQRSARDNRELLRDAMESAGFVALDAEWWHFEWGTARWAATSGTDAVLDRLQPQPSAALISRRR